MTKRKHSPLHDKWHPRVEGQIRDCTQSHPRWFNFTSEADKADCINSLAKRIVGEIVSDLAVRIEPNYMGMDKLVTGYDLVLGLGTVVLNCRAEGVGGDGGQDVPAEPAGGTVAAGRSILNRWWAELTEIYVPLFKR